MRDPASVRRGKPTQPGSRHGYRAREKKNNIGGKIQLGKLRIGYHHFILYRRHSGARQRVKSAFTVVRNADRTPSGLRSSPQKRSSAGHVSAKLNFYERGPCGRPLLSPPTTAQSGRSPVRRRSELLCEGLRGAWNIASINPIANDDIIDTVQIDKYK